MAAFAGRYADGRAAAVVSITPRGLVLERPGRLTVDLEPETGTVFFSRTNLRRRYIFEAASGATPARLIARDENDDRIWERRGQAHQQCRCPTRNDHICKKG